MKRIRLMAAKLLRKENADLAESLLLHTKQAYLTGRLINKVGIFEQADSVPWPVSGNW